MKVKLYTTTTCPWCEQTKEFLKKYKIEYEEVDVSTDSKAREQLVQDTGQMGVPVTVIDDELALAGFNEKELKKALKIK